MSTHPSPGPGAQRFLPGLSAGCRRVARTRSRRLILLITVLLGLLAAVAVAVVTPPADRTFATVSFAVQALMSVTAPFLGVLALHDLPRPAAAGTIVQRILAAEIVAAGVAVVGILVSLGATAVAAPDQDRWQHAGPIAAGSLLVQLLAQSTGTALGLLVRSAWLGCLATIVLPLGLWLLLGAVPELEPLQDWLTPFSSVPLLLSGQMSAAAWGRWLVVLGSWGGLNLLGALRARR